jgi:hypothetical protein
MLVAAGTPAVAVAGWVAVDVGDTVTSYVDPSTIRRTGDMVKLWGLNDNKSADTLEGKRYMSYRWHNEYNCADQRSRSLYHSAHAGSMGRGEVIFLGAGDHQWTPVAPGSVGARILKIACVTKTVVAGWVETSRNEFFTTYADFSTIRRTGNGVTVWELIDSKAIDFGTTSTPPVSFKLHKEYDCQGRVRVLSGKEYSAGMGRGKSTGIGPREWQTADPPAEIVLACGK